MKTYLSLLSFISVVYAADLLPSETDRLLPYAVPEGEARMRHAPLGATVVPLSAPESAATHAPLGATVVPLSAPESAATHAPLGATASLSAPEPAATDDEIKTYFKMQLWYMTLNGKGTGDCKWRQDDQRPFFVKIFKGVPRDQWKALGYELTGHHFNRFTRKFQEYWAGYFWIGYYCQPDIRYLFKELSETPPLDRLSLARFVNEKITTLDVHSMSTFVPAFNGVPCEQWEDLYRAVNNLIPSGYYAHNIWWAISRYPAHERLETAKWFEYRIGELEYNLIRPYMLCFLAVPHEQWDELHALKNKLMILGSPHGFFQTDQDPFSHLAKQPANERLERSKSMIPLYTLTISPDMLRYSATQVTIVSDSRITNGLPSIREKVFLSASPEDISDSAGAPAEAGVDTAEMSVNKETAPLLAGSLHKNGLRQRGK